MISICCEFNKKALAKRVICTEAVKQGHPSINWDVLALFIPFRRSKKTIMTEVDSEEGMKVTSHLKMSVNCGH